MIRPAITSNTSCLNFSNAGGVDCGNGASLQITNQITIACWVKIKRGTGNFSRIISKENSAGTIAYALLLDNTANTKKLYFQIRIGSSDKPDNVSSISYLVPDRWYFIVAVYDGVSIRHYVNGQMQAKIAQTGLMTNVATSNLLFGTTWTGGLRSQMYLNDARIWNVALTDTEIENLYGLGIVPQRSALAGEWLFNEGSGSTATDSSGNGNNGAITSVTYSTDVPFRARTTTTNHITLATKRRVSGRQGSCFNLTGANYARVTNASPLTSLANASSSFSISCWARMFRRGASDGTLTEKWELRTGVRPFSLRQLSSSGKIRFDIFDGTNNPLKDSNSSYEDGKWHHIVAIRDNTARKLRLYIDGTAQGSDATDTTVGDVSNTQNLMIGCRASGINHLKGSIDDVRIWNVALSASEVTQLYQTNNIPEQNNLIGEWLFDEASGNALDTSGYNNTAVFTNGSRSRDVYTAKRNTARNVADLTGKVTIQSYGGFVRQLNNGSLIRTTGRLIYKSTDNGATWTTKYTSTGVSDAPKLFEITSNGNIFIGFSNYAVNTADMVRSTDNGETWAVVATSESDAWWRLVEDTSHNLYANEYSRGNQDASELYAYNVWKSTDNGATWAKFHSEPAQSVPGVKDGIRHVHHVSIDSSDNLYVGFGDYPGYAGNAGKIFNLNSDGSLGTEITPSQVGNGMTSFFQNDFSDRFFGSDLAPYGIYKLNFSQNTVNSILDLTTAYTSIYSSPVFDFCKGKDGVIYAITFSQDPGGSTIAISVVLASADDGKTWKMLLVQNTSGIQGLNISCNRNVANSLVYLYLSGSNTITMKDYTRDEIRAL